MQTYNLMYTSFITPGVAITGEYTQFCFILENLFYILHIET